MSLSPITAETTPDVSSPIAAVARTPATTFLLTFSAKANARAPRKTIAERMTATQIAQALETVRKFLKNKEQLLQVQLLKGRGLQ